ncbi:MAG: adenine phosphoribosyltransferase [Gemmatimonadota bacterium]
MRLAAAIRNIPDFPKPGIHFKDITPVLLDADLFRATVDALAAWADRQGAEKIAGVDARGFLFAAPVADRLGLGLIPIRKPGKLPFATRQETYALEYGENTLAIHTDAVAAGERVVIIDDLLATGGTVRCAAQLIEGLGGVVGGLGFVVELDFLAGRDRLTGHNCFSLLNLTS